MYIKAANKLVNAKVISVQAGASCWIHMKSVSFLKAFHVYLLGILQNQANSVKLLCSFLPLHPEKPNLRAHETGLDWIKHFQTVGVCTC